MPTNLATHIAKGFRRTLTQPARDSLAFWGLQSAVRLHFALRTQFLPDGSVMPPNTPTTLKAKRSKGFSTRAGVRTGNLMDGLRNTFHPVSKFHAQVLGSDGRKRGTGNITNDEKAILLIKGRHARVLHKTSRGKKYLVRVPRQIPRDYVGHDEKVVDKACVFVVHRVLQQWGFC